MTATLEGVNALLEKSTIIPTFKARDLARVPETVEAAYEHHVRSYVPLSRGVGESEMAGMTLFERRLFDLLRDARAPIGYVAAEYGHGKTSTGLFLWRLARERNVLAVPPFSLDHLDDIVTAVSGWVRFEIERALPGAGSRVDTIAERYRTAGVEELARLHAQEFSRPFEAVLVEFRRLDALDKLQTDGDGLTYVSFLGEMTDLAKDAGFDGLLVIADELQQYIEHADVARAAEPIGRLFDLITTMLSRTGRLPCGLIFLLPNKELGLLNQQRGDLVQRIKASRLALDLTQLYTPSFAADLWERLTETFEFADIKDKVITPEALLALGEIAARADLASGPRTVVDVLKIACDHFRQEGRAPYDMLDLVASFEQGEVAFDGVSRIQNAVRQALAHDLVRGNPQMERAVRVMAAFPSAGLSKELQERAEVRAAVDDLTRLTGGELVAIRGGGYDHTGRAVEAGVTLMALRPAQEQVSWLKATIREFRRGYYLHSDAVQRLAVRGISTLITSRLFPTPHWKVEREFELTPLSQNQALLLQGAFQSAARRFPERVLYLRIIRPDEEIRSPLTPQDLLIDFALSVPAALDDGTAEEHGGAVTWLAPNHVRLELNLLHRTTDATYLELSPGFEDIVAPYDVNPLLTLSLHAHLSRLLESGAVPGAEESNVRDLFLPALHTAALRDLFHAELGRTADPPLHFSDTRLFEELVLRLCERTYGDAYVTLMASREWRRALEQYRHALHQLDNPFVQNGNEALETTKRDLATLLGRTNATVDNFLETYPQLVKIEAPFRGANPGRVRFTLHPLEQEICSLLQSGERRQRLNAHTGQVTLVPTRSIADLTTVLTQAGYRVVEVEAGIQILEARGMIEVDQQTGAIALAEPDVPSLDLLQTGLEQLRTRIKRVQTALDEGAARMIGAKLAGLERSVLHSEQPLRSADLVRAYKEIAQASAELEREVQQRRHALAGRAQDLRSEHPVDPGMGAALAQPLNDALFGGQLDAVRRHLQEDAHAEAKQVTIIEIASLEALTLLNKSNPSDKDLIQGCAAVRKAETEYKSLVHRRDQLHRRIGEYRVAAQMLSDACSLLQDKLTPLGDTVVAQREAFQEWSRWVTGQLAERRVDALQSTGAWQERLGTIKSQIAAHEQALRTSFNQRQDVLRRLLIERLRQRPDALPAPLAFNPAHPEESERLLVQGTRAALEGVRDRLLSQVERIISMSRELRQEDKLASLPVDRREQARVDMQEAEEAARRVIGNAAAFTALSDAVSDGTHNNLEGHAAAITALEPVLQGLFAHVHSLTRELQDVELTPEEERALQALRNVAQAGAIDMGTFERVLRQELPRSDAWALARVLVQKSRARIHLELIDSQ